MKPAGHYFIRIVGRTSLLGRFLRFLIARLPAGLFSLPFLIDFDAIERPHYAYCIYHAADLARRLGYKRFSVLEFGVAWGFGLAAAERLIGRIEGHFGIKIDLWGFDTGTGMPTVTHPRDIPYLFKESQFHMDEARVRKRAPRANLVLGDVKDTIVPFLERDISPIGVLFIDVDIYTSTRDALKVLSGTSAKYLPRLFFYLDDAIGTPLAMFGPSNGELLAMREFNAQNAERQIHRNENLQAEGDRAYARQIFYGHLYDHPDYTAYIGGVDQAGADRRDV